MFFLIPHIDTANPMIIGISIMAIMAIITKLIGDVIVSLLLYFIDKYNFITDKSRLKQVVEILTGQINVLCKLTINDIYNGSDQGVVRGWNCADLQDK